MALHEVTSVVHGSMVVYTERAETAAVLNDTRHGSAVLTPLQWIVNKIMRYKQLVIHVESNAMSARERTI